MPTKYRVSILTIWLMSIALLIGYLFVYVKVVTDVSQFMPAATSAEDQLLLDQLNKGIATRMVLMALEGKDNILLSQLSRKFASKLRDTQLFVRVDNGENLIDQNERQLLFQYRYLLDESSNSQSFQTAALNTAFRQRLAELSSPASAFNKQHLTQDPTNALGNVLNKLTTTHQLKSRKGLWFSADQKRALLLAESSVPSFDLNGQQKLFDTINTIFANIDKHGEDIRLHITGPGIFAIKARNSIHSETRLLSIIASASILLITLLAFRSLRVVLTSGLPLLSAVIVASASVNAIFGELHGITLAFGVTLLGVAIDYPIHVFSHLSTKTRVIENIRAIWPTLRLGILTTTMGYLAMVSPSFSGLAQLGIFAMIGLLTAAAITRWILPALLPNQWCPAHNMDSTWLKFIIFPSRRVNVVAAIILGGLCLIVIILYQGPIWQHQLTALSPLPQSAINLDNQLRKDMGATGVKHVLFVSTNDIEKTLQHSEYLARPLQDLVDNGIITGFDLAAHYLPSHRLQLKRQNALPSEISLRTALHEALEKLPFKPLQFEPFIDSVTNSKRLPPLNLADLTASSLGIRVASLLYRSDNHWIAVIPLSGLTQESQLKNWLALQNDPYLHYLSITAASNGLIANYQSAALERIKWSSMLILLVLWLGLRHLKSVGKAIFPVLLAIILDVFILLFGFGDQLTLFHLVALLLVFGIGIDYSLFFGRAHTNHREHRQTAYAIVVCALSTFSVFVILAFSNTPVLAHLGKTVALGVVLCFLTAMLLSQRTPTSR